MQRLSDVMSNVNLALHRRLVHAGTDFVHYQYFKLALHGKKALPCKTLTEPIDLMALLNAPNPNFACNNQTALWSNGIQASSEWQYSRPVVFKPWVATETEKMGRQDDLRKTYVCNQVQDSGNKQLNKHKQQNESNRQPPRLRNQMCICVCAVFAALYIVANQRRICWFL